MMDSTQFLYWETHNRYLDNTDDTARSLRKAGKPGML